MYLLVEWQVIVGSTLVSAAAYDGAAERIYVRLHSAVEYYFDDCSTAEWAIGSGLRQAEQTLMSRISGRVPPVIVSRLAALVEAAGEDGDDVEDEGRVDPSESGDAAIRATSA